MRRENTVWSTTETCGVRSCRLPAVCRDSFLVSVTCGWSLHFSTRFLRSLVRSERDLIGAYRLPMQSSGPPQTATSPSKRSISAPRNVASSWKHKQPLHAVTLQIARQATPWRCACPGIVLGVFGGCANSGKNCEERHVKRTPREDFNDRNVQTTLTCIHVIIRQSITFSRM